MFDEMFGQSLDDPKTLGLLQMAAALSSGRKFMPALAQGLLARQATMQHASDAEEAKKDRALRRGLLDMQVKEAEARQRQQQGMEDAYRNALRTPEQMAMAANGGPTLAAAQAAPGMQPGIDQNALIRGLMQSNPVAAAQMMQPKPADLMALSPGQVVFNRTTGKEQFRAPEAQEKPDEFTRRMIQAGIDPASPQGQQLARQFLLKQTTHAPAPSATVINQGQKGLDNTLKLRGDFRGEPIYKAHQEMQSAYGQIQHALKMASPAGDLAGATKIMKLLDPGSVVRESELGMAMAATGLMDRVTNYADMILKGNKLTPDQRKDFQSLSDKLFADSQKLYNAKRAEYQGIAERNGLNVLDVLGPESAVRPSGLSPSEEQELAALRARFGGGR